jgi:hypothetical protein
MSKVATMNPLHLPTRPFTVMRRPVRGVSLVFSLLTLAALSLAAVALIRSVDTGASILGNLSFKQDTAMAADEATRQAVGWLADRTGDNTLWANVPPTAIESTYFASNIDRLDPTGHGTDTTRAVIDWDNNGCANYKAGSFATCIKSAEARAQAGATPGLANGVTARFVILRLCAGAGDPRDIACARPLTASAATSVERDELRLGGGARLKSTGESQYFRILVRARGGRNTVTYTETLVHF